MSARAMFLAGLGFTIAMIVAPADEALAQRPKRDSALRFSGRFQLLSGAAFSLPEDAAAQRHFVAYVPIDAEIAVRVSGLFSIAMGSVGYLAPFSVSICEQAPSRRPNALGAFLGMRFDFNNSQDGSWWSPWMALRTGVLGQDGTTGGSGSPCDQSYAVGLYLSPRLGVDLWMGKAAVTFAIGYDHLPRAAAISTQLGLTLRLF